MHIHQITTPELAIYSYLLVDTETKKAAVIDPSRDYSGILKAIAEEECEVVAIFETHVHADFISGATELKNKLPSHPLIYCSGLGGDGWTAKYADVIITDDRQAIDIGNLRLEAWHTPGHSPEHVMWLVKDSQDPQQVPLVIFSGDFLFAGSIGRPDLLGAENLSLQLEDLYHSIFEVLPELPDSLRVYPSHGQGSLCGAGLSSKPFTTLYEERQSNPYLQLQPHSEWMTTVLKDLSPAPIHFSELKKTNLLGPKFSEQQVGPISSIDELKQINCQFIDIRPQVDFAHRHLKGSLNLPLRGPFITWAPRVISYDKPFAIVADSLEEALSAVDILKLVGLDYLSGYYLIDDEELAAEQYESFEYLEPWKVPTGEHDVEIIDVRTLREWQTGHIPGARYLPLDELISKIDSLPKEKRYGFVCGSGYRASLAASLLQKHGYRRVFNIKGGMTGWKASKFPIDE